MKTKLAHPLALTLIFSLTLISCSKNQETDKEPSLSLEGTWELLSETKIEKGDTTFSPASANQRMIKIINKTHFSFLRHDLNAGKDSSALFVAGGGTYQLNGNTYTENLEFCNFREWENHTFTFTVNVVNDTLVQQGTEKVEGLDIERVIIEKYKKAGK
ncbi:hypothetical protein [Chryseosolibacter indicus]|uniref:Lipocalin-like domain-containing protein n=1 Tax=Chryseosolibacter indicus TaxID=2782351 RepID=A0ABS5VTM0_9BACT|nr:hypothetical protein [Chryseosolibacter indicus]MBT1704119.1 hypothetical protein [Chryseosolibacter indicus]